ncbi:uncharacterized protein MYCFIDRAFT_173896 [Pseudocercospora fijiensis CIRAD86]|uniref:Uncharacterized protein n=1 Tax=Pseudocercospora fijiensis (strain CIRAD86) TaxID=383855 RepID=M3A1H3_PSEFD|nr:uncharacterized protein MYCFIDRAFT_173896 [Pseudocercospora fijiensis CIRAD86]EME85024.1 hypothetical protein MYCFIDRAFT_173896 [Pseudocercospora fijiensis CIRAD86]
MPTSFGYNHPPLLTTERDLTLSSVCPTSSDDHVSVCTRHLSVQIAATMNRTSDLSRPHSPCVESCKFWKLRSTRRILQGVRRGRHRTLKLCKACLTVSTVSIRRPGKLIVGCKVREWASYRSFRLQGFTAYTVRLLVHYDFSCTAFVRPYDFYLSFSKPYENSSRTNHLVHFLGPTVDLVHFFTPYDLSRTFLWAVRLITSDHTSLTIHLVQTLEYDSSRILTALHYSMRAKHRFAMLPMSVILPESHDKATLERSAAYLQTELAISQRRYRLLEDDFIDLKERYEKRCHDLEEQLLRTYQLCKLQEFQKEKAVAYCSDLIDLGRPGRHHWISFLPIAGALWLTLGWGNGQFDDQCLDGKESSCMIIGPKGFPCLIGQPPRISFQSPDGSPTSPVPTYSVLPQISSICQEASSLQARGRTPTSLYAYFSGPRLEPGLVLSPVSRSWCVMKLAGNVGIDFEVSTVKAKTIADGQRFVACCVDRDLKQGRILIALIVVKTILQLMPQ